MPVVSALDDPATVFFLPHNLADVMGPDDDGTDGRTTRIRSVLSPRPREVILRSGIAADLLAHVPAAPCPWSARIVLVVTIVVRIMMVAMVMASSSFCARSE